MNKKNMSITSGKFRPLNRPRFEPGSRLRVSESRMKFTSIMPSESRLAKSSHTARLRVSESRMKRWSSESRLELV